MFRLMILMAAVLVGIAAGGCAGTTEYDAEPDSTLDEQSASIGAPEAEPAAGAVRRPVSSAPGAVDRTELLNAAKLEAVPEQVRTAFQRDFPDGGITSIYRLDAATGLALYEINFLRRGRPYDVVYRPNGTFVTQMPVPNAQ